MNTLVHRACSFLEEVYDPGRGLFPYTTRLIEGRYVSSFDHPAAVRYSVICLLALRQLAELEADAHAFPRRWKEVATHFIERHEPRLVNPGDRGLFLVLAGDCLGSAGPLGRAAESAWTEVVRISESGAAARLSLQELCWLVWGATHLARGGLDEANAVAGRLFELLTGPFLDERSSLPRHGLGWARRTQVSFGGIAYYLRAMHEVTRWRADDRAETLFRKGLERALAIQGPEGEWPWFVDARTGRVIDLYPVYGVHQDSMSMLFLLPALDRGLDVAEAIERSYGWVLGRNQLGRSMIVKEPFLRYRALERRGALQRPRRYARSLAARTVGGLRLDGRTDRVRVNRECRSYELGWIVFAWAGRKEEFALEAAGTSVDFRVSSW